jgi:hypothetical protein
MIIWSIRFKDMFEIRGKNLKRWIQDQDYYDNIQ